MKICAEREFDALFDSFSALMKIPRILSLIGRGEDKNLTKRYVSIFFDISSRPKFRSKFRRDLSLQIERYVYISLYVVLKIPEKNE